MLDRALLCVGIALTAASLLVGAWPRMTAATDPVYCGCSVFCICPAGNCKCGSTYPCNDLCLCCAEAEAPPCCCGEK